MLDAGTWPFPDQAEAAFWRIVEPIIGVVEAARLRYVHPPFFRLNDIAAFEVVLDRLEATCATEFGVVTLGTRQTVAATRARPRGAAANAADVRRAADVTPRERAERVVSAFAVKRHASLSFAIEPHTGEFISPHLYLAARRFLDDE